MSIVRALRVMFHPPVGTAIYLGILVTSCIVQFVFIDPHPLLSWPLKTGAFMLGNLFAALGLKLFASAVFGGYADYLNDAPLRSLKRIPRRLKRILSAVLGLCLEGSVGDAPPYGTMFLLALVLFAGGAFLSFPLLDEYPWVK